MTDATAPIDAASQPGAPVLILGAHRSGTSLVSGLLWAAGLHLGSLLEAGPENPKGFFESVDVLDAHDGMLLDLGRDWTCPPHRFDVGAVDLEPLEKAVDGLGAAGRTWGVKDPRLMFLLPAWIELLPAMRIIGVVRHPAAIAGSLAARNGFSATTARAIADTHLARLATLQQALGFPVVDFDDADGVLPEMQRIAGEIGLTWDDDAAADLYDPGLRHQRSRGSGGEAHDLLVAVASARLPLRAIPAHVVARAVNDLPDTATEPVPLVCGPAFLERRPVLWEYGTPMGPHPGRVLDIVPDDGRREPILHGIDRVEIDFAHLNSRNQLRGARAAGRYTHVIMTGVIERISRDRLAALLDWLNGATASDAIVIADGLLVDGERILEMKRWPGLALTSQRTGTVRHHHLDEIELAAFEGDWMVADLRLSSSGRSMLTLVKRPDRRRGRWMTAQERRAVVPDALDELEILQARVRTLEEEEQKKASHIERLDAEIARLGVFEDESAKTKEALDRETTRHRLAYEALLKENADIRHMHHEEVQRRKAEVKELKRLRSVRYWLRYQAGRFKPARLAAGIKRRFQRRS